MSLPYHIGNGVFGGLVPLIGVATIASTGNILAGLYFSIVVAAVTFVVGMIFMKETHGNATLRRCRESDHGQLDRTLRTANGCEGSRSRLPFSGLL